MEIPGGRTEEISRVMVNVWVHGATDIYRIESDGQPYADGGRRMRSEAPYWTIPDLTIPLGAYVMLFKVTIPWPGEYEVLLTMQSPDFYDKRDHLYLDSLTARPLKS